MVQFNKLKRGKVSSSQASFLIKAKGQEQVVQTRRVSKTPSLLNCIRERYYVCNSVWA